MVVKAPVGRDETRRLGDLRQNRGSDPSITEQSFKAPTGQGRQIFMYRKRSRLPLNTIEEKSFLDTQKSLSLQDCVFSVSFGVKTNLQK